MKIPLPSNLTFVPVAAHLRLTHRKTLAREGLGIALAPARCSPGETDRIKAPQQRNHCGPEGGDGGGGFEQWLAAEHERIRLFAGGIHARLMERAEQIVAMPFNL